MLSAEAIHHHFRYTEWATNRLLDTACLLNEAVLLRDFGTADKSILGTLRHLFHSERIWLARMLPRGSELEMPEKQLEMQQLQSLWPDQQQAWQRWAENLDEQSLRAPIAYLDLKGNSWRTPPWHVILHLVNHSTHHRGQISGFTRASGQAPPQLDLIAYYRFLPQT